MILEIDVKFGIYYGQKAQFLTAHPTYVHFRKEPMRKKSASSEMEIEIRYIDSIINIGQDFLLCAFFFINSQHFFMRKLRYNNNNIIINNMLACLPFLLSYRDFFIQQKTQQHYEYHHHQKTSYISFEMKVALSTSICGLER